MPRTVEQVDKELREAVAVRLKCRTELARRGALPEADRVTYSVRQTLMDERIERLLDERSQLKLLAELSAL